MVTEGDEKEGNIMVRYIGTVTMNMFEFTVFIGRKYIIPNKLWDQIDNLFHRYLLSKFRFLSLNVYTKFKVCKHIAKTEYINKNTLYFVTAVKISCTGNVFINKPDTT